ncbi:MAG: low molecular weight phosphotyrosine protein phosphatase [Oscillospiraceae bacterium]|nr:low molecular weight phosphotyrosine protein phosphatase [Oscillospiraceae bacterium]
MHKQRILFICYGNICRSPMAHYLMQSFVQREGLADLIEIDSAATSREELGNPIYPPAKRELEKHGVASGDHRSRQITAADYEAFDWLIGMETRNVRDIRRICGDDPKGKIVRLLDFTDQPGDIADPWYTGDYSTTWREILAGCTALLARLK